MNREVHFNLPGRPNQRLIVRANSASEAKEAVKAKYPFQQISFRGARTV